MEMINADDFKSSSVTVIEGPIEYTLQILFRLCVDSIIKLNKDSLFIDCRNTFNPYEIMKILKEDDIRSNIEQRKVLSRMHIVRAFTEYQLESIVSELNNVIARYDPSILIISYMPELFRNNNYRLFNSLMKQLISTTISSDIITVITSFGSSHEDKFLASKADRVINIEKIKSKRGKKGRKVKKKDIIKIVDNGKVSEMVPTPDGQTRFDQF